MNEHPDQTALFRTHEVLRRFVGEQTATDIVNAIQNEAVVFRMAAYWLDRNTVDGDDPWKETA